jgi:hypothetical protein
MTTAELPPWHPDYVAVEGSVDPNLDPPWVTDSVPPVSVTSSTAIPAGQPSSNWAVQLEQAAVEAAQSALREAAPTIQQQVAQYTQSYITGILTGKPVAFPTITGTTLTGQELTIASARNRSWRTFLQGLGLDLVFALVAVVGTLGDVNFFSKAGWVTLGILIIKTVIQTVVSYVARVKIAPPYESR